MRTERGACKWSEGGSEREFLFRGENEKDWCRTDLTCRRDVSRVDPTLLCRGLKEA